MLTHSQRSAFPARNRVIIMLSIFAGLRAAEIAQLDWSMVLDARGKVGGTITIRDATAKKGSGRRVPMHSSLRRALIALERQSDAVGPVVRLSRGGAMRPNSIVN
jgi:integrase/recombinase XerD